MNNLLQQAPTFPPDDANVPARAASAQPGACPLGRPAVVRGGPHLTEETPALRRSRLRAAAFILSVGFAVFLCRHALGVLAGEPLDPLLLGAHALVVLVLAYCSLPPSDRPVAPGTVRVTELIVFGLPAGFFLLLQHRLTLADAARGHAPPPLPFWLLLVFTYGTFIPNTWRRAARVVGALALAPGLLLAGMVLGYPEVAAVMTPAVLAQHGLVLAVAAVAAVFGTHLIYALRGEAFEARRLGQYRLLKLLGAGGMGEVYLAEHRMLKRPCAVKLIRPERTVDPGVLARFEREVQMTARLSHWNTVEVYDYGRTEDGTFFYVMEYLPGLSLEELLTRHGPLPAGRAVYLLRQACQALREAHAVGLIHRDVKPGNVFVSRRGGLHDVVKLLDFGLVKPVSELSSARLTREDALAGTPLYMSPEQARGLSDLDARSDLYSLGAVAYALLTGRAPFERPTPWDVLIAHARDAVVPPSALVAGVPAELERVILRCLAKRPEDRFPDADSLDRALAECAAASQWTQAHAARWWLEHEGNRMAATTWDTSTTATVRA